MWQYSIKYLFHLSNYLIGVYANDDDKSSSVRVLYVIAFILCTANPIEGIVTRLGIRSSFL